MPYDTSYLPKAVVKIYADATKYADITYKMIAQPIITKNVNRGGSFTFSLPNKYFGTSDNYISDTFSGWNTGSAQAIDWGMYVSVEDLQSDGTTIPIIDGIITTIDVNDTVISFECADMLAIFGRQGTELHRNYYDQSTYSAWFKALSGGDADKIEVDITDILNAGGTPITPIYYRKPQPVTIAKGSGVVEIRTPTVISSGTITGIVRSEFTANEVFSKYVVNMRSNVSQSPTAKFDFRLYNNNGLLKTVTVTKTLSTGTWDATVDFGMLLSPGAYTLEIEMTESVGGGSNMTYVYTSASSYTGTITRIHYVNGTPTVDETITNKVFGHIETTYVSKQVTASSVVGNKLIITSIADVGSISADKPDLIYPAESRCNIPYTSGTVAVEDIMEHIAGRLGATDIEIEPMSPGSQLNLFRTGGGYALDYLQKLADISNADGDMMSFTAYRESNQLCFRAGRRRSSADAPSRMVSIGIDLISSSLRKTMKSRPSRAMLRGTISGKNTEDKPVIAIVRNASLEGRRGLPLDTVITDSNSLTVADAIISAYGQVNSDAEDWEGEMTIAGIIPDMIDRDGANAGSGKVLSVSDYRYPDIDNTPMVVTSVKYDYEKCTTTVKVSNAPRMFSSQVSDGVAEAYSVGDVAINSSNTTLYKTQYCYLSMSTGVSMRTSGNDAILNVDGSLTYHATEISVYRLPTGKSLLYCAFQMPASGCTNTKYGTRSLTIVGNTTVTVNIPADDRPDAYNDQYIIFNVEMPTV